jgi:hypothetical protein
MGLLPIVERELRVAAHRPRTWWRRVVVMLVALGLGGFVYATFGQWGGLSRMGQQVFVVLAACGTIYALLAGPHATVDCLSAERREGTLGLLFLTDLRSYDVVLGKMAAASLNLALDLTAALPVIAIPVLMGGVSLKQLAATILALVNIMFLSLATGVLASAMFDSARSALAVTLGWLCLISLGLVLLGTSLLKIHFGSRAAPLLYWCCPLYGMSYCLANWQQRLFWPFWVNLGGMQLLSWGCLVVACWRTRNSWRGLPESSWKAWWRGRRERWRWGSAAGRLVWRQLAMPVNPVSWLEGRDQLQERLLWAAVLGSIIFWGVMHLWYPQTWPDHERMVLWVIFSHYILCLVIAIQAPRRLADDQQSGALELLLCTPVKPRQIVSGSMWVLWRRYGRAQASLLALDAFLVYACFSARGGWQAFLRYDLFLGALGALVVFPLQGYSLARVGLYQGLVQGDSVRASLMTIWKVGLSPWLVFFAFMVTWETVARYYTWLPRATDRRAWFVWAGVHLLACGAFVTQAAWRLDRRFRALAAHSRRPAWWKRWSRSQRKGD